VTILVDGVTEYPADMTRGLPGRRWSHMVSDVGEDELHDFARRLGLKRAWFQSRPNASAAHYDLVPSKRALALKLGAVEVTSRELVARNYDGLRRRQRCGAYLGDNDATTPQLTCLRARGHTGLCDNVRGDDGAQS
jgi:hypothetical protein